MKIVSNCDDNKIVVTSLLTSKHFGWMTPEVGQLMEWRIPVAVSASGYCFFGSATLFCYVCPRRSVFHCGCPTLTKGKYRLFCYRTLHFTCRLRSSNSSLQTFYFMVSNSSCASWEWIWKFKQWAHTWVYRNV